MLDKTGNKGALKTSFAYIAEPTFADDKFIQEVPVYLDQEKIDRLWSATKYPIIGIEAKSCTLPDFEFGTKRQPQEIKRFPQTIVYDHCQSGLKFMIAKSKDPNGRPVFDLLATFTLKTPKGMSIGLYYLPDGNMKNICFLGRVCHHMGTNDHQNTDGTVVDKNQLHIHKITEKYIRHCMQKYGGDKKQLISHLQSADATVVPGFEHCTIRQMADVAREQFNIADVLIAVTDLEQRNLFPQFIDAINENEKGMGC